VKWAFRCSRKHSATPESKISGDVQCTDGMYPRAGPCGTVGLIDMLQASVQTLAVLMTEVAMESQAIF